MILANTFEMLCKCTESDIYEHLPTLLEYGRKVEHITEFGVRNGRSTVAWWCAAPTTLRCYDINKCDITKRLKTAADPDGKLDYEFIQIDVLGIKIEETDLIFFDTYHTYTQLSQELKLHGNKAQKYLIFHDTVTYGERGEDRKTPGIMAAIDEFKLYNPCWEWEAIFTNNNGLLILKRRG